jgi:hypothetical protein
MRRPIAVHRGGNNTFDASRWLEAMPAGQGGVRGRGGAAAKLNWAGVERPWLIGPMHGDGRR